MTPALPSYVVVTPVRDEARFIGKMVDSMLTQSHKPVRWVIVDDGSTDGTVDIVRDRIAGRSWISLLSTGSRSRNLGVGEIIAFTAGMSSLVGVDYDFVVKLDADVHLYPDYFEKVLSRMQEDPKWGIASGQYWEEEGDQWAPVSMPAYHAAGASKVVRTQCYNEIGGFVPRKGWDTVDEIRAGLRKWRTGHFPDVRFDHLKPEGAAMGSLPTHRFHGEIYYQTGGGAGFLVAKVLHRMYFGRPMVIGGLAMLFGYLRAYARCEERLVTNDEARHYRSMLWRRLMPGPRKPGLVVDQGRGADT